MTFKTLDKYPQTRLTEEQSNAFANMMLQEMMVPAGGSTPELEAALGKDFISQIITKRLEAFGGKMSPHLTILLSFFAQGNPGTGLMYAHAVHMATPVGQTSTTEIFANIFAMGIPNEEEFVKAWDGQKIGAVNGIDYKEGWERT